MAGALRARPRWAARGAGRPARRQAPPWRASDRRWGLIFIAPQLFGTLLFVALPLFVGLGLSFTDWDGLNPFEWVGLGNFRDQLTDPLFLRAVLNTLVLAAITIPIGLGLALLLALGLNGIRGRSIYLVLLVAPVVSSSVAVAMIWQQLFRVDGALSTFISTVTGLAPPNWLGDPSLVLIAVSIVIIWSSLGLNVLIFLAGIQTIPKPVVEAATVDGAGSWATLLRIKIPLLSPTIFFATVVAAISSLQTFDTVFVLTKNGGPDDASRTIVYHVFDLGFRRFELGVSSAAALILLVMTLGVTLVQFAGQRRFVHYES
jgi:multiple sugar transport system permease protein